MVNEQFTPRIPKSEEEGASSDSFSNTERAEWAWILHEGFDED